MLRSLGHLTHFGGPFRDCWFCRRIVEREVAKAVRAMKQR